MTTPFYICTSTIEMGIIYYKFESKGFDFYNSEPKTNWAFLDMQNLYKGVQERNWKIEWHSFKQYLIKEHNVSKALAFMGFIEENVPLYKRLEKAGFKTEFREVKRLGNGNIDGGNVDADLASYVMDNKNYYDKAIIIADDGDYCQMIKSLNRQNKLKLIISSHNIKRTSGLIKDAVEKEQIISIHSLRNIIEDKAK